MLDIINQAQALDLRRQAQINNQKKSIDRLLNLDRDSLTPVARYTEEMGILHQTIAVLTVERDEAKELLTQLVRVFTFDGSEAGPGEIEMRLAEALSAAKRYLGLSDAVSESRAATG